MASASSKFCDLITARTGPKISSQRNPRRRRNVLDDGRRDVVAAFRRLDGMSAVEHHALALADLDVVENLAIRLLADDRPRIEILYRIAGLESLRPRFCSRSQKVS